MKLKSLYTPCKHKEVTLQVLETIGTLEKTVFVCKACQKQITQPKIES